MQDSTKKIVPDLKVSLYDNLKSHLKKYCNKNGSENRKKCKDYCLETKKNKQAKDLYKKYCKNNDDEDTITITQTTVNELTFIAGTKEFKMQLEEGESVFDFMKRAKSQAKIDFKYTDYGGELGVMITEINGVENGNDNKYWILYVSGIKSSKGCSNHKLNKSDTSIEWKYEKYSF